MTVLLLCNVGDRDVKVRDEALAHELGIALIPGAESLRTLRAPRAGGKQLWDRYDDAISSLTFDILDPCLAYVLERHRRPIDRLVLFGTDQPEGLVADVHRQKDTLHLADLMARYYQGQAERGIREAEARYVQEVDAALYDEAFEAYGRLLADLPRQVEACYLVISGGMPACNAALLLQGVRRWAEQARVLYLPKGRTEPRELRAGEQILGSFRRAVAEAHLARLDFAAAAPLLGTIDAPRALCELAAYAQQRLDLDLETAQDTLVTRVERHGDLPTRRFVDSLRHDLDWLFLPGGATDRLRALLAELFWNSEIAYQQQRYADFLARVYRFQEAVLRYLVETVYGWPTDVGPAARETTVEAWNRALQTQSGLRAYLTSKGVSPGPLAARQINRYTFKALLAYVVDAPLGPDAEGPPFAARTDLAALKAQLKRLNAFDELVELRNRSVVGHDFEGVSLVKVWQAYAHGEKDEQGQPDPVRGMRNLLGALRVDVRENPYRRVAEFIVGQLGRL